MYKYLTFVFLFIFSGLQAQESINLEDLWKNYVYNASRVPGFNFQKDGKHYTKIDDDIIKQFDLTTGAFTKDLLNVSALLPKGSNFDSFSFSEDESKMLLKTDSEAIYRRSSKANFLVYDPESGNAKPLFDQGKQMYATFNPSANKVAFVHDNNLYYKDLSSDQIIQITTDGKFNEIINGSADWVYEEEFAFAKAFFWSGDGNKIAFYRFDESQVNQFTMTNYTNKLYPDYVNFKYPKTGEDNAIVSIHIYDLNSKKTAKVDMGRNWEYVPRLVWTKYVNKLCVYKMNRHQNNLELLLADAKTGSTTSLLKEENKYYIEINDALVFLKDGKHFLWMSEKSGYNHLYLYDMQGKVVRPLTKGDYDVTNFYGIDEVNQQIYYQAAKVKPTQRELYAVSMKGKKDVKISKDAGTNSAQFSSTFDYYVNTYSTANAPSSYQVFDKSHTLIRTIEDNGQLKRIQELNQVQPVEFFNFKTSEDVSLNGYMIKPPKFDANKKYPVFMYVYGGPGSQTVKDSWGGQNYWWFQMLAQKGYVIVSVDNRGTGARGAEFKKMTYKQLGKYETIDQIEAAKYLAKQPYVDGSRIGIFGWSYGGYMTSLCLFKGADVFKTAIAVAPVTNWKWYDSIYTERYMRTPQENERGYEDNSPINFTDQMKGNYMIVHGISDDNVHFQNSAEMVNALISSGKHFESLYYPNRNHGIYGGNTRLHLYEEMTDFILEKL